MNVKRKIKTKNPKTKILIPVVIFLILLTAAGVVLMLNKQQTNDQSPVEESTTANINYSEPTEEQVEDGLDMKKQTIDQDQQAKEQQPVEAGQPVVNNQFSTTITTAQVADNMLLVRNEISRLTTEGECILNLTNGSQKITKQASIGALARVSTCQGFNIPTSELSKGKWQLELVVKINDQTATDSKEVEIK